MFNRVLLRQSRVLGRGIKTSGIHNSLLTSRAIMSKSIYSFNNKSFAYNPKASAGLKKDAKNEKLNEKFTKNEEHKEEEYQEFHHDETNDAGSSANFSTGRKILFALGKLFKYSFWTYCVLFAYHFYLVRRKDRPEEAFG